MDAPPSLLILVALKPFEQKADNALNPRGKQLRGIE